MLKCDKFRIELNTYNLNQVVPEVKITQSLRKDIWSSLLLDIMKLRWHIAHNSNVK